MRALDQRSRGLAAALLLIVAGCSSAPSPSGSPGQSATGPLADVVLRPLPAVDQISFTSAAQAELDLIAEMRADAGFAEQLGEDGDALIAGLDEAGREQGEATLPAFATELGLDLSASLEVAALPGAPGSGPRPPDAEWSGSLLGQVSGTISMVMGLMTQVIGTADQAGSGTLSRPEQYTKHPTPDTTEVIDIKTTYRITSGGGSISADVDIESTDVITDASGTEIARLVGKGHGHIEVNACPDGGGQAAGSYTLEWQEDMSQGGSASGSNSSTTAPFNISNGDDAHWTRIDTTMDLSRGATGAGASGGDWSVEASVPMTIPSSGRTVIGYDQATVEGNGSQDQVNRTVNGTFGTQQFLIEVAREAEKFWRSGKCIELTTSEESREVDPEEEISLSVDSTHKFDGSQINAPITASFTGKEKLEPANTPVDPPASFDFTAGKEPGDVGTIQLEQTSRRGIGKKTVTFTVQGLDLVVTADGSIAVLADGSNGVTLTLHMDEVKLTGSDGQLTGSGPIQVTGTVVVAPCSPGAVNDVVDATVYATRDEADTNLVHVYMRIAAGSGSVTLHSPENQTFDFPYWGAIVLWGNGVTAPIAIPINESVTVSGDITGTATITVTQPEPPPN